MAPICIRGWGLRVWEGESCSRWSLQSSEMEAGPCVVSIMLPRQLWGHTLAMLATSRAAAWSVIGISPQAIWFLQIIVLYQQFDWLLVLAWPGIPGKKIDSRWLFPKIAKFILQMKHGQVCSPCLKWKLWRKYYSTEAWHKEILYHNDLAVITV